ncbi:MAG TPA: DUF4390 domain-containing protein [Burkholderiaceae bacterium]|nr:DUF4390 domain-containing protein [Burkholderiaceae bacterium]HMZ02697.1 DUF4390 domain-containing protein [Burkholderiaceae bacterium]HNB47651.1 DUF4390 domain-containing protein [Burkholderiaceae bacterium]HNG79553.1 DUF4390 domain-containing protein [Burkholderiaceae bacterium]
MLLPFRLLASLLLPLRLALRWLPPAARAKVAASVMLAGLAMAGLALPAPAQAVELTRLEAQRSEQGVLLSFDLRYELPPGVEGALQKGVALYFVAEAQLMRSRWYWMDRAYPETRRVWRLSYQPLTFSYRVSLGGLSQTFATLAEALRALQRSTRWRIADALPADDDGSFYVRFSYRLDAEQLPRPLQIGIAGGPEWHLAVERTIALPAEK